MKKFINYMTWNNFDQILKRFYKIKNVNELKINNNFKKKVLHRIDNKK